MSKKKKKYAKYKKDIPLHIVVRPVVMAGITRFVIVDRDTDKVFDDNQGYGYKTRESALSFFSTKSKANDSKQITMKKIVKSWCSHNSAVILKLRESLYFSDDELTDSYFIDFLSGEGINVDELPFSIKDLRKYLGSL